MRFVFWGGARPVLGILGLCAGAALVACQSSAPQQTWGEGTVTQTTPGGGVYQAAIPIPSPDAPPRVFDCKGPWSPTTSEDNIMAAFGQQYVIHGNVPQPNGTMAPGSILLPNEPKLRVEIAWADALGYTSPTRASFSEETRWGVQGVSIDSTLAEVVRANGGPFKLVGFGGTNGGMVTDWLGGRLGNLPGPCKLGVQFALPATAPDSAVARVSGSTVYSSTDDAMRAISPTVGRIWVNYVSN